MTLTLRGSLIITGIIKPTVAKFFAGVKVDDVLRLSTQIIATGRGHSGLYATRVRVECDLTGRSTTQSLNQIVNRLACFEYEEL